MKRIIHYYPPPDPSAARYRLITAMWWVHGLTVEAAVAFVDRILARSYERGQS